MEIDIKKDLKVGEITQEEKTIFEAIRDPDYSNIALLKIIFNGVETSCICSIHNDKDNYRIQPIAILTNPKILEKNSVLCPSGQPPEE